MTNNARAKIVPSIMLVLPPVFATYLPNYFGLPISGWLALAVFCATAMMAGALAGAKFRDQSHALIGAPPAYWVPVTTFCVASAAAGMAPALGDQLPGISWAFFLIGFFHAFVDLGSRITNR